MPGTHEDFVQQWRIIYTHRCVSFHSDNSWTGKFHWTISYHRENINPKSKIKRLIFFKGNYINISIAVKGLCMFLKLFVLGIFVQILLYAHFCVNVKYIDLCMEKSMINYLCLKIILFVHFHGSFLDKFLIYNLLDYTCMSHFHSKLVKYLSLSCIRWKLFV